MSFSDYPKTMVHPAHAPAIVGEKYVVNGRTSYGVSTPERFANIHVHDADQEEEARAKGYLAFGETKALPVGWAEYPKTMMHPDHLDAVPEEEHAKMESNGSMTRWKTPGTPEKFPHKFVKSVEEEAEWEEKGYKAPGISDPDAVQSSRSSPYVPNRPIEEYPKWVDGVLVQDPRREIGGIEQYPKFIGCNCDTCQMARASDRAAPHDRVVNGPEEEAKLLGRPMEIPKPVKSAQDEALEEAMALLQAARDEAATIIASAKEAALASAATVHEQGPAPVRRHR